MFFGPCQQHIWSICLIKTLFQPLTPIKMGNYCLGFSVLYRNASLLIYSHLNMNFFFLYFAPELWSSIQADFVFWVFFGFVFQGTQISIPELMPSATLLFLRHKNHTHASIYRVDLEIVSSGVEGGTYRISSPSHAFISLSESVWCCIQGPLRASRLQESSQMHGCH